MYWPLGAPNVYAVSTQATERANGNVYHSGDGAEGAESSGGSGTEGQSSSSSAGQERPVPDISVNGGPAENGSADSREDTSARKREIIAAKVSRGGGIFATITRSTLTLWQTKPIVALASVVRSDRSMKSYGPNTALMLRPDALIIVVQTSEGYLITYSLASDPNARVYATQLAPTSTRHARKDSVDGYSYRRPSSHSTAEAGPGEGDGIKEVSIRFRMVIRIDAGISKALALDDELVVATQKPAALQCIQWATDNTSQRAQTSTELIGKMSWVVEKCTVTEMVHDRPMNLMCWITSDGRAYAVQRRSPANVDMDNPASLFQGFCFRDNENEQRRAVKAAIDARFSLVAVGCADGSIDVYIVKDYMGNIPLSHQLRSSVSQDVTGNLKCLSYSPDGYALFGGFERGWAMWSVYGKPLASSFSVDRNTARVNGESWLKGAKEGFWTGGGCEIILLGLNDDRLWNLEIARDALTGCFSAANMARGLLHSSSSVMLYKGHDIPDPTFLHSDASLWQTIQVPASYLLHHWPIKMALISSDAKYVAVAGRRGLAHYSIASGRWKTFDDPGAEHEFAVRGGMVWYQHFLIACVEAGNRYQIRIYSREKALDYSHVQFMEDLAAPAVYCRVSGADSLLVYTYDNTLLHFIVIPTSSSIRLVQVGQIGFHGIIRAPPRVRAISWILPEDQLEHGDPSQDVATASVLFLVDGKLVLLQPSTNEQGELKYDMRVIAQNVEFYFLLRDEPGMLPSGTKHDEALTPIPGGLPLDDHLGHSLRDSLWYFDGSSMHVWSDVQDVLASAPADLGRDLPPTVRVPVDFYPVLVLAAYGIIAGLDSDLVQRRDINFSFYRHPARTQLFLPQLLRWHLAEFNEPAALHLSQSYKHLPYFAHALEVLLHDILDHEVDNPPSPPEAALLPTAISFLSSFDCYLDVIVNCTRKTELRSWRTLFSYLPPVLHLFQDALAGGKLKTAAGYLLVLHTFEHEEFQIQEFALLLRRAAAERDWELCKELARFLVGIDSSGENLRAALGQAGLVSGNQSGGGMEIGSLDGRVVNGSGSQSNARTNGILDYFSIERGTAEEDHEQYSTPET